MAIKNLGNYNRLYGINLNEEEKTISVDVGIVSWDCDVLCVCDAIEYLAEKCTDAKSITIETFNLRGLTIYAGESPVEVYNRIREQYRWYWEPMPDEIAEAQKKFEARKKNAKGSGESSQPAEPGERE